MSRKADKDSRAHGSGVRLSFCLGVGSMELLFSSLRRDSGISVSHWRMGTGQPLHRGPISIVFQEHRIWHQEAGDSTTSPKSG